MSLEQPQLESIDGIDRRLSETQEHVYENVTPQLRELFERVEALEAENERLRARLSDDGTKDGKVREIVRFAHNKLEPGRSAVKLTAQDIKGAAGCSRRYAYDLMDELPQEYDWFLTPEEMTQYGSLEIDNGDVRRLGVDFEGVHSSGCPLNKFTTPNGSDPPA